MSKEIKDHHYEHEFQLEGHHEDSFLTSTATNCTQIFLKQNQNLSSSSAKILGIPTLM